MRVMRVSLILVVLLLIAPSVHAQNELAQISGQVIDAESQAPIAGAQVIAFHIVDLPEPAAGAGEQAVQRAVAGATGEFAFSDLTPGRYHVRVEKPGFAGSGDPMAPDLVEVRPGENLTGLRLTMTPGAVFAGRVVDEQGNPAIDVMVFALKRADGTGPSAFSMIPTGTQPVNDAGEFRLANLPAGDYVIVAMPEPRDPFAQAPPSVSAHAAAATYYPGTHDRDSAQLFALRAGETIGGLHFAMVSSPSFTVSGIVVDGSGRPVPRALVMMPPSPRHGLPMVPNITTADENGAFRLEGVVPGAYVVAATRQSLETSGGANFSGGSFDMSFAFSVDTGSATGASAVVLDLPDVIVNDADVSDLRVIVGP